MTETETNQENVVKLLQNIGLLSNENKNESKKKVKKEISAIDINETNVNTKKDVIITDSFKKSVMTYIDIDDKIKKVMEEIKELKNTKKTCENEILDYLTNIKQTTVRCGSTLLKTNESMSKGSLKNEQLKEVLTNELQDQMKVEIIMENLEKKKADGTTKKIMLKRTKRTE